MIIEANKKLNQIKTNEVNSLKVEAEHKKRLRSKFQLSDGKKTCFTKRNNKTEHIIKFICLIWNHFFNLKTVIQIGCNIILLE